MTPPRFTPLAVVVAAGFLTLVAGCTEPRTPDTIPREVYVEAWVELRRAALSAEDQTLTDSARASVLERAGVTEEELLGFAEVHGPDLDFMRSVWDSVAVRLDSLRLVEPGNEPGDPGGASGASR